MKKLFFFGLLLTIPSLLNAFDIIYLARKGWYVAGAGSYDWYQKNTIRTNLFLISDDNEFQSSSSNDIRPDESWNACLSFGFIYDHWRVEVEGNYRPTKENKTITNTLFTGTASTIITDTKFGIVSKYAVMVNAFFDLPIIHDNALFYIGGGVGVAFSEIRIEGTLTNTSDIAPTKTISFNGNEDESRFAFQFMTGISKEIICDLHLTFGYRLFGTTRPNEQEVFAEIPETNTNIDYFESIKSTPLVHSIELGLRVKL